MRYETVRGFRRSLLVGAEKLISKLSTEVLAVSPSLASELRLSGIAPEVQVVGAGSTAGVDIERFSPSAEDIAPLDADTANFLERTGSAFVIVFIGRIHRDKGVDDLIDALQLLSTRGDAVPAIFVGPEEDSGLVATLKSAAASIPIHVAGAVEDPRPYILAASAICLPSLREGFGQVIVEAAAMSVPAIATDATGLRDVILDGQTGLRVPVRDTLALAEAIARLAADPALVRKLGHQARTRATELYDSRKVWALNEQHFRGSLARG